MDRNYKFSPHQPVKTNSLDGVSDYGEWVYGTVEGQTSECVLIRWDGISSPQGYLEHPMSDFEHIKLHVVKKQAPKPFIIIRKAVTPGDYLVHPDGRRLHVYGAPIIKKDEASISVSMAMNILLQSDLSGDDWIIRPNEDFDFMHKYVRIATRGCVLHPFNSVWRVRFENRVGDYSSARILDRIMDDFPSKWCEILPDSFVTKTDSEGINHYGGKYGIFGSATIEGGVSMNSFRKLGYYAASDKAQDEYSNLFERRSQKFSPAEYDQFEQFIASQRDNIISDQSLLIPLL